MDGGEDETGLEGEAVETTVVGQRVAVYLNNIQCAGTVVAISTGVLRIDAGGDKPLTFEAFAKKVDLKVTRVEASKFIKIVGTGESLHDVLNKLKKGREELVQRLQSFGVRNRDDIVKFHEQNRPKKTPRYAYRVCRIDEDTEGGVKLADGLRCARHQQSASPAVYFTDLTNHVWHGSRTGRRPFISATWDLKQALWWSYGGIQVVVEIDMTRIGDDCLFWDVGGTHSKHSELLYAPTARNYAQSSAELVFDNDIPGEACRMLEIKWEPRKIGTVTRLSSSKDMPLGLPESPKCIEVLHVLQGTTSPLRIKILSATTGQEKAPEEDPPASAGGQEASTSSKQQEVAGSSPSSIKKRARKPHTRPAYEDDSFVLKRGGYRQLDPWHASMEYFALQLYGAANIDVPPSALYPINVVVVGQAKVVAMSMLLTRFINGVPFKQRLQEVSAEPDGAAKELALKQAVRLGLPMDLALCNIDVCGPDYSNLIVANDGQKVFRVDVGGSTFFNPDGSLKDGKLFLGSKASVDETIKTFYSKPIGKAVSNFSRVSKPVVSLRRRGGNGGAGSVVEAYEANAAVFRPLLESPASTGEFAGKLLRGSTYEGSIDNLCAKLHDSSCAAAASTIIKRLRIMASLATAEVKAPLAGISSSARPVKRAATAPALPTVKRFKTEQEAPQEVPPPPPPPPPQKPLLQPPQPLQQPQQPQQVAPLRLLALPGPQPRTRKLREIIVVRSGDKAKFIAQGYKVINVTSRGEGQWAALSPFHAHGQIPIPGTASSQSCSVEGLWQGLKVFEHEGVDETKFANYTGKNLKRPEQPVKVDEGEVDEGGKRKRGKPRRGKVLYHWWGPLPSSGASTPQEQLGYVEARRRIYAPAYVWVLEHKVHALVKELALVASEQKVALVDYFTNSDISDTRTPLSHAALLKAYVTEKFDELVQ